MFVRLYRVRPRAARVAELPYRCLESLPDE